MDVPISEVNTAETRISTEPGSFVMVVEDDTAFRWLLSEALSGEGFEVLTAANGREALQLYRENIGKVWLVVADVMMPEMDGLTAASEMRKIDDNVCFIFMSGYDTERIDEIGVKLEDIPRSNFLRKPFGLRDMTSRIRALEGHRKGAGNAK
jgi:two-component system cell cycle sensor histidine kinase/response regulator CckA